MILRRRVNPCQLVLICAAILAPLASAQPSANIQRSLQEIFGGQEGRVGGRGGGRGGGRWTDGGKGYLAAERGEIVRYDTVTGQKTVLLSAAQLTPKGNGKPLTPGEYVWSEDGNKLMVMTNTHRELIRKTAGEYWVLDRKSGSWQKLGGDHSDLMFAKLSPDGSHAGYLRGQNIYVEDLATGAVKQLTSDGSDMILNGVSDWVYDEEFRLNDAWRWSPDGTKIAYWQFDQSKVPVYTLINYTDALYPTLFQYPYPKAGQTNSAVRIGVVKVTGGPTTWVKTPGDPRNIYISRMEWAGNSTELVYELLNRLQNIDDVMIAIADTGAVRRMLREQDDAWVEDVANLRWVDHGKRLLWSSERDGWRHSYTVGRDGDLHPITDFPGDVISVAEVDERNGWLYFIAHRAALHRARQVAERGPGPAEDQRRVVCQDPH
jgi:dipeptidyl-peptidase-4